MSATNAASGNHERLLEAARTVLAGAKAGEQVEVYAARSRDTTIRAFEGEVESLSSADAEGVGVRVIADQRQGFAFAGSLDPEVLADTLAEARDNASFASPDEHLGLPEPDGVTAADLDLWQDELDEFPADRKVELALDVERRVRAGDPRIRQVPTAAFSDELAEVVVVSTTGIESFSRRGRCVVRVYALAGDGDDVQTGAGFTAGRQPSDLDVEKAAADAVRRSTRMLGAKKPKSTRVVAVLEPDVTATLLSVLAGTLSGDSVLKGRSLFAERIGEEVSVPWFTLVEDPTDGNAYGASPFDAEGLATRRTPLIEGGVLQGFLYDSYAGRRAGVPSTASAMRAGFKSGPSVGARALALAPGRQSPEELLRTVGNGLLVQGVSGVHSGVNPVSGDFSVGAEGLMIRDGQIAEPVREITIASTIQRMLKEAVAAGNDVEWIPGSAAGLSLAIDGISMSGA